MAVSPIYLESLKTYEHFADQRQPVSEGGAAVRTCTDGPIESLKRRVLQVQLVRNTRILEISATLPDAAQGAGAGRCSWRNPRWR